MKRFLLIVALCVGVVCGFSQKLRRKNLKVKPLPTPVEVVSLDTLPSSYVRITGYDKPLRARHETMIATNTGTCPFDSLALEITYSDTKGNMLHARTATVFANISPGCAKTITLKSWDVNNTYYYFLTPPSRSVATPYTVKITARPIVVIHGK